MSESIESMIEKLKARLGDSLEHVVKFDVDGVGTVIADQSGVRQEDSEAVVTLSADMDTFAAILNGEINPAMAVMSGKVKIDGDMSAAMSLNTLLA